MRTSIIYLPLLLFICSCEKEISLKLPPASPKIVIEGFIEKGSIPIVIISQSISYYDTISYASFANSFVKDATVYVEVDGKKYPLSLICLNQLPPILKDLIVEQGGKIIYNENLCFYTEPTGSVIGTPGKTYTLHVYIGEDYYYAVSKMLNPVPIDKIFIKYDTTNVYAAIILEFQDPPEFGDSYFAMYKRFNSANDTFFKKSPHSISNDKFTNGQKMYIAIFRAEDPDPETAFFKKGNTVAIKLYHMEYTLFEILSAIERQSMEAGGFNPFSSPVQIPTNIRSNKEALGYWGAFAYSSDTVVLK